MCNVLPWTAHLSQGTRSMHPKCIFQWPGGGGGGRLFPGMYGFVLVCLSSGGGGEGGGRLFPGMYGFVLVRLSSGAYGLLWVGTVITKQQRIKTEVFRYFEWTSRSSRDLLSLVGVSIFEVVFVPGCVRDRMWVLR